MLKLIRLLKLLALCPSTTTGTTGTTGSTAIQSRKLPELPELPEEPITLAEIRDTLAQAYHIMEVRGHVKFQLTDHYGHVCLRGAVNTAMTGLPIDRRFRGVPTEDELAVGLTPTREYELLCGCEAAMGFTPDAAVYWNNLPGTTEKMVLDRLAQSVHRMETIIAFTTRETHEGRDPREGEIPNELGDTGLNLDELAHWAIGYVEDATQGPEEVHPEPIPT